jgi:DNA-binding transcriptional LysR family regulator
MHWSDRIGRRLKPHELHIFLAVAERGNMAKAAEYLSISRPVVSKAIASLEQIVGVPLFDRNASGVEPTRYGAALQRRAIGLFDELRQTVNELSFLANPNSGELRIGCTEVLAGGFVAALIADITARYPGLAIRTELGSVVQQYPPLRERRCELFVARAGNRHRCRYGTGSPVSRLAADRGRPSQQMGRPTQGDAFGPYATALDHFTGRSGCERPL